jgi:hypothetical protein
VSALCASSKLGRAGSTPLPSPFLNTRCIVKGLFEEFERPPGGLASRMFEMEPSSVINSLLINKESIVGSGCIHSKHAAASRQYAKAYGRSGCPGPSLPLPVPELWAGWVGPPRRVCVQRPRCVCCRPHHADLSGTLADESGVLLLVRTPLGCTCGRSDVGVAAPLRALPAMRAAIRRRRSQAASLCLAVSLCDGASAMLPARLLPTPTASAVGCLVAAPP